MQNRIAAIAAFLAGAAMVAAPIIFHLGWPFVAAGIMFGIAVGVFAGVLWAAAVIALD